MDGILTVEPTVRVRYAETDAQGIVHHTSYVVWFEVGRSELFRSLGASYRDFEAQGFVIVLADLQARYHAPARYDDLLVVQTTLTALRSRQIVFGYEIRDAHNGALLVSGSTTHVVLDHITGRPTRLPPPLLALLKRSSQAGKEQQPSDE